MNLYFCSFVVRACTMTFILFLHTLHNPLMISFQNIYSEDKFICHGREKREIVETDKIT